MHSQQKEVVAVDDPAESFAPAAAGAEPEPSGASRAAAAAAPAGGGSEPQAGAMGVDTQMLLTQPMDEADLNVRRAAGQRKSPQPLLQCGREGCPCCVCALRSQRRPADLASVGWLPSACDSEMCTALMLHAGSVCGCWRSCKAAVQGCWAVPGAVPRKTCAATGASHAAAPAPGHRRRRGHVPDARSHKRADHPGRHRRARPGTAGVPRTAAAARPGRVAAQQRALTTAAQESPHEGATARRNAVAGAAKPSEGLTRVPPAPPEHATARPTCTSAGCGSRQPGCGCRGPCSCSR